MLVFLKDLFNICTYTVAVFGHSGRRMSDLVTDSCEPPCGCWDLNSGPLEEQSVLLTTEPSLQPRRSVLKPSGLMCLQYPHTQEAEAGGWCV